MRPVTPNGIYPCSNYECDCTFDEVRGYVYSARPESNSYRKVCVCPHRRVMFIESAEQPDKLTYKCLKCESRTVVTTPIPYVY